jgi:hypothetical protein
MTSAFIKAMHNKPKLFDDEVTSPSSSKHTNTSNNNNTTSTETVTFSTSVPDRHRSETRQVSEAMFGSARNKQKSAYSSAETAAQIEQRLRNREIGVRGGNASTNVDDSVSTTTVTTTTTVHLSPSVAATTTTTGKKHNHSDNKEKSGKVNNKGKTAPDEVFRHMRTDPTFLELKRRFDESHSAADALACAKHLVAVSAVEASVASLSGLFYVFH